jgi:hypothetical protein
MLDKIIDWVLEGLFMLVFLVLTVLLTFAFGA